jgi:GNAT superfamily N-acetyltransferase
MEAAILSKNPVIERLRRYYQTAVADLRYQGLRVLLWRTVVKLCSPVVKLDLQILFELDLSRAVEARRARVDCTLERASEADIDEILDMQMRVLAAVDAAQLSDEDELEYAKYLRMRATAHEVFVKAMRAGEACFVARVGGDLAHSNWVRFHDSGPMDGRPVDLLPGEVYTTDAFTDDRWRGQGLHEAVLTHMLRHAQSLGCHRAYTLTDFTKAGSRRGVRRVGWSQRGLLLYVIPRGLGRTWLLRLAGDLEPMFRHARSLMTQP